MGPTAMIQSGTPVTTCFPSALRTGETRGIGPKLSPGGIGPAV